jgi:hypothetical protein
MSYKIKSLLYFVAFVISAIILYATDKEDHTVVTQKPESIDQAITDNSQMEVTNEAGLLQY